MTSANRPHGAMPRAHTCRCRPCRAARADYERARTGTQLRAPARLVTALHRATLDITWMERALCPRESADLWFSDDAEHVAAAIEICTVCPVRPECLAHAIETRERHGVWGATTPEQRRQIARRERHLRSVDRTDGAA